MREDFLLEDYENQVQIDGKIAMAGSFRPEPILPTCNAKDMNWSAILDLPKVEYLEISKNIMAALWNSLCQKDAHYFPCIKNADDIINAINNGWAYNANEADSMLTLFGDIRAIVRDEKIVRIGAMTPDGTIIRGGRELITWRDKRLNSLNAKELGLNFISPIASKILN